MSVFCRVRAASSGLKSVVWRLLAGLVLSWLAACSPDSRPDNPVNPSPPVVDEGDRIQYKGPSPATADVQRYLSNVWLNVALTQRCGACHIEGGQAPQFARRDSIDEAYKSALTVVDLAAPSASRMVTKVASGHQCWRDQPSVCADTLTSWISAWANAAGVSGTQIVLTPPAIKPVGASLPYPEDPARFVAEVYEPYLRPYCRDCHSPEGSRPQQPYFASGNITTAYEAAKSKMQLSQPARSRMVLRLREESHNCWSGRCTEDAAALEAAIARLAASVTPTQIDPRLITSNALVLTQDGLPASAGGRVEPNVMAKYEFKTGEGTTAYDTSGQEPPLDLRLSGEVAWLEAGVWGLRFQGGRAQASTDASKKLWRHMRLTGEFAIEAWVAPANVNQEGPARIVSYSGGDQLRNFMLGQTEYNYNVATRTRSTDEDARPLLSTPDADEVLQATLQHVVASFNVVEGKTLYVNGVKVAQDGGDSQGDLSLTEWDDTFALIVGSETSGMYPWAGTVRFLALHGRSLSESAVAANFNAGVGEKFLMLFRITHQLGAGAVPADAEAYIVFTVEPFDSYSYLFSTPYFVMLPTGTSSSVPAPRLLRDIPLKGLRIGMNGREQPLGQAFASLDITLKAADYVPGEGIALSRLGALMPVEQGKTQDAFFLTFDHLDTATFARAPLPTPPVPVADVIPEPQRRADVGLKTFAQLNASFSAMTAIPVNHPAVRSTYEQVEQQLPVDTNPEGFLPAHQMGITQLAVAYCAALISDPSARSAKFPGFQFNAPPASAFDSAGRSALIAGLVLMLAIETPAGEPLLSGPSRSRFERDIHQLLDQVTDCGNSCTPSVTANAAIAACSAALGSAAVLVH